MAIPRAMLIRGSVNGLLRSEVKDRLADRIELKVPVHRNSFRAHTHGGALRESRISARIETVQPCSSHVVREADSLRAAISSVCTSSAI